MPSLIQVFSKNISGGIYIILAEKIQRNNQRSKTWKNVSLIRIIDTNSISKGAVDICGANWQCLDIPSDEILPPFSSRKRTLSQPMAGSIYPPFPDRGDILQNFVLRLPFLVTSISASSATF